MNWPQRQCHSAVTVEDDDKNYLSPTTAIQYVPIPYNTIHFFIKVFYLSIKLYYICFIKLFCFVSEEEDKCVAK